MLHKIKVYKGILKSHRYFNHSIFINSYFDDLTGNAFLKITNNKTNYIIRFIPVGFFGKSGFAAIYQGSVYLKALTLNYVQIKTSDLETKEILKEFFFFR